MCKISLLNRIDKHVVDEFEWPTCIVKMLSFYEALGYEIKVEME